MGPEDLQDHASGPCYDPIEFHLLYIVIVTYASVNLSNYTGCFTT